MGKHYNVQNWIRYKHEMDFYSDRGPAVDDIEFYYPYVIQVAHSFPKSATAIGCLTILDLIQSGNVGLVDAWKTVDLDRTQGEVWSYLKTRIKFNIRQDINRYANMIKIPERLIRDHSKNMTAHEKILVNIFPKFFDEELMVEPDEISLYKSILLEDLIVTELNESIKNRDHIDILLKFYGIGFDKMSQKELAEKYKTTNSNIQNIVLRLRKKLDNEDFEKKIENFYNNQ